MLKRLLSYIIPVNIHTRKSAVSKTLEVTWNDGQLVLDSANTNYSFGSLQRVLRRGLKTIGLKNVGAMQDILLLGVGAGSVIRTILDETRFKGNITGVDIDADIVEIANRYFGLNTLDNVQIIIDDAFEFVLKTKERYDLIIIDIFQDTQMPNFIFEDFFSQRIGFLLRPGGYMLFNTMILSNAHEQRNLQYLSHIDSGAFSIIDIPRLENHNHLILVRKKLS